MSARPGPSLSFEVPVGSKTARLVAVAVLVTLVTSTAVAAVTVVHLDHTNPLSGSSSQTVDGPVRVESWELVTDGGSVTGADVTVSHLSEHRVGCTLQSVLAGSNGTVVTRTPRSRLYVPANGTRSTVLDFQSTVAPGDYMLFTVRATDCSMLGWPMAGFDAARTGSSTTFMASLSSPPTLTENWSTDVAGSHSILTAPALSDDRTYVGGTDDAVRALHAANGSVDWRFDARGDVNGSIAVAGDTAYAADADGTVYALDAVDGAETWRTTSPGPVRSSPAVADGTVFVGSDDDSLYALNATDGASVWSHATGGDVRSSPAVVNGTVYVGSLDGAVYALDASDGSVAWTHATGGAVRSSPAVVNDTVYVGSDDGSLSARATADGSEVWTYAADAAVRTAPAIVNGTVYVGTDAGTVAAVDATTGTERWTYDAGGRVRSSPAVGNETVYVGSGDGTVYALHAANGTVRGTYDVGDAVAAGPAAADDVVYVASRDGGVTRLAAGATGWRSFGDDRSNAGAAHFDAPTGSVAQAWNHSTGANVTSSAAVVDHTVFVGGLDGAVYALTEGDGAVRWSTTSPGPVHSSPAVVDGRVYVGSRDDSLYALQQSDGAVDWTFPTGGDVDASPTVYRETVYAGSDDDSLYALDADSGTESWSFDAGGDVPAAPAAEGDSVYAGSRAGTLYALDTADGTERWRFRSGQPVVEAPAFADGTVYVPSEANEGPIQRELRLRTAAEWREGTFDGTSPDGANGTLGDQLSMTYANGTSGDSLVAYWRMDRNVSGTGGIALDYSGNGNHGTAENGIRSEDRGVFGTDGYNFDSEGTNVSIDDSDSIDVSGSFSVSFWLKTNGLGSNDNSANQVAFVDKGRFGNNRGYEFLDNGDYSPHSPEFRVYHGSGYASATIDRAAVNDDQWHHMVGVWDASSGTVYAYLDGVEQDSVSNPDGFTSSPVELNVGSASNGDLDLPNGNMDEVQIYDEALSRAEVRDLSRNDRSGTYFGNFSRTVSTGRTQEWTSLEADLTAEPAGTDVTATVQAVDDAGSVVGSQTVALDTSTTTYDLSLPATETARLEVNGTTTDVEASWRLNDATVVYERTRAPSSSSSTTNATVSTAADWSAGTFVRSTADAATGADAGRLTMTYPNGTSGDSLQGYWRLDDDASSSGGTIRDYSGNDFDGSTNGGLSTGDAGVFETSSVDFTGNGDGVTAPNDPGLEPTNAITVSMWVRRDGSQVSYASPVWYGQNSQAPYGPWGFQLDGSNDAELYWHLGVGGTTERTSTITLNDGEWHHVVGTYNGSGQAVYRDGQRVHSRAVSGSIDDYDDTNGLAIGDRYETGRPWDGNVDEVQVYDRALSPAEIDDLYRTGGDGTFESSYARNLDTSGNPAWDALEVAVPELPGATSVDVTVEALDETGTVQSSRTVTPTAGANSYSLSFANTTTTRIEVNGTSTNATQSWSVERISLENTTTTTTSAPLLCRACWPVVFDEEGAWDAGSFEGTTADGAADVNAGRLRIGYANGTGTDDLAGYWRLDRDVAGAGGTATDYSGNGNDGTTKGSLTTGAAGVFGSPTYDLDGTDDYVEVPDDPSLDLTGSFTVSAWVNVHAVDDQYSGVVTRGNQQWGLQVHNTDEWAFYTHDGGGWTNAVGDAVTTGQWVHVVGRYDASTDEMSLWLDGRQNATASTSTINSVSQPVGIGDNTGETNRKLDGRVDEVRIYSAALSDDDIRALHRWGRDGEFQGNYSQSIDTRYAQRWDELAVNVTDLPSGTEVNATVEAVRSDGSVAGTQTVTLSSGEHTHPLDLPETEDATVFVDGTTADPLATWAVENVTVHRERAAPDQRAVVDTRPQWQRGVYDGTSPDAWTGHLASNLSLRYANGTADDALQAFYRFDGDAATGTKSVEETLSTVSTWDGGVYDGTTADAATAAAAGDLSMTYPNGTDSDDLRGYYRFDRDVPGGGIGANETIDTLSEWNAGSYDGTTADGETGSERGDLTMTYANGTGSEAPKVYYRLDGSPSGSSGTVEDYSGNDVDGTTHGTLTTGSEGVFDTSSFDFDGTDDYVSVGSPDFRGDVTVSAWVNLDGTSSQHEIVSGGRTYFALRHNASGYYVWRTHDGSYHATGYDATTANSWVHLVGRIDTDASDQLSLWVDGTQVDSEPGGITDPGRGIEVGRDPEFGGGNFDGRIDEVRMYNTSLSDAEVRELYRNGRSGTYYGNYTRTFAGQNPGELSTLEVDAARLPATTSVNVTVESIDASGSVVDASTHAVTTTGGQSFGLSLSAATDTRVEIDGSTTDVTRSFEIDSVSLTGDEPAGTSIDYGGGNVDGIVRNGVVSNASGVFGTRGYRFDGDDDYVDLDQPAGLDFTDAATVSAWVNLDQADGTNQTVVAKGESQFRLVKNHADEWAFATDDGTRHAVATTSGATAGTWVHLVGRIDPSATEPVSLWVDGTRVGSTTGGVTSNGYDVTVGRENETGGDHFDGSIDEVRLYDRALSDAEVRGLYRHGGDGTYDGNYSRTFADRNASDWSTLEAAVDALPADAGVDVTVESVDAGGAVVDASTKALTGTGTQSFSLSLAGGTDTRVLVNATTSNASQSVDVGRLTLNGSTTTPGTAVDYSGNGDDASARGGVATSGTGAFGSSSFAFDGSDDEVVAGNPGRLNLTGDLTIGAWVNADAADASADGLVTRGTDQYALRVNGDDRWEFAVHDGTSERAVTSSTTISTNEWVYLVGRYDVGTDQVELFVNGASQGTASVATPNANDADVVVGNNSAAADRNFDGSMDEVRIYDRALSDDAVRTLYRHGGDGTYRGNYSHRIDTGRTETWSTFVVNVTGLPPSTAVDATLEARDGAGTVVDSQTIALSGGETSHSLSLADSEDLRVAIDGTSTDPTRTWAVENATVSYHAASGTAAGDAELVAVDAAGGGPTWALDLGADVTTSPAVDRDTVYVGLYDGTVLAVNATTGERRWQHHTANATLHSSPAVVDETVYVGSDDGHVYALNATDGTERWTEDLGARIRSSPVPINESVYVGADDHGIRGLR